ncbi:MAG TPA: NADH-quinone oxidoreductase subunit C [Spirochaetota bacterium]|mgnify:CR=1 FL=1|nr:NADH-quinone oxidoreductase subunit C [Spirochaetota bacterium]
MRGLNSVLNIELKNHLVKMFPVRGFTVEENRGILVIQADASDLVNLMNFLKTDPLCDFNVLIDLTAVDYLHKRTQDKRFDVVYMLWSTATMQRIRVKVTVAEGLEVPTVSGIWKGANWPEREVFDLFGIVFSGHPVMERIVMPENFRGHPLRKDFPLEGRGEEYLIESIMIHPPDSGSGSK